MEDLTPITRREMFLDKIADAVSGGGGGGGGGGFTPTQAQLDAMNSGITAEKLQTDENDILTLQQQVGYANTELEGVL